MIAFVKKLFCSLFAKKRDFIFIGGGEEPRKSGCGCGSSGGCGCGNGGGCGCR